MQWIEIGAVAENVLAYQGMAPPEFLQIYDDGGRVLSEQEPGWSIHCDNSS